MSLTEFIIRILAALASGMIIGLEREFHQKRAGLRTHSLVSLGSAIFVLISLKITVDSGGDPSRIIGQVATGIGFLGAGVILRQGGLRIVRGLSADEREDLLACWIEIWRGVVHAHRTFMDVTVIPTADSLTWTIAESDRVPHTRQGTP